MKSGRIARSSWDNMWIISCKKQKIEIKEIATLAQTYTVRIKKWNKKCKALPHFSVVEEIYLYQAGK